MKLVKNAGFYTIVFFIILILLNSLQNPRKIAAVFEKGFWPGIGVIASAFILLYILILTVTAVGKLFSSR